MLFNPRTVGLASSFERKIEPFARHVLLFLFCRWVDGLRRPRVLLSWILQIEPSLHHCGQAHQHSLAKAATSTHSIVLSKDEVHHWGRITTEICREHGIQWEVRFISLKYTPCWWLYSPFKQYIPNLYSQPLITCITQSTTVTTTTTKETAPSSVHLFQITGFRVNHICTIYSNVCVFPSVCVTSQQMKKRKE